MKRLLRPILGGAAACGLAFIAAASGSVGWAPSARSQVAGSQATQQLPSSADAPNPFSAPSPPSADEVRMLRFPDGSIRFGAIVDHDADGIEIIRVDTSGRARLTWDLLDEAQAQKIKNELGYVEIDAAEVFVQAERLLFAGGGSVIGVVVSREGDHFLVKTGGSLQKIPKVRVRSIETRVQIPALDVYTREEMYARLLSEAELETAKGQLALAQGCEGILDFVHAAEHYGLALEAGLEGDKATRTQGALARSSAKAEAQGQLDILRGADQQRRYGNFDEAIAIVNAFPGQFPDSPLIEDARKAEVKLTSARDDAAKDLVRKRWNHWAKRLTRTKASTDSTFEEMRGWAVDGLSNEIQQKVFEDLTQRVSSVYGLEDVRTLWDMRERRKWSSSTFGTAGSWLLGAEAAQAGIEAEEEDADGAAVSAAEAERRAIDDRVRRYAQNQRAALRGGRGEADQEERDEFWRAWSGSGRALWLLAYYAENGGDYELRPKPLLRNCTRCAGVGAIDVIATGTLSRSELSQVSTCPLCRGVQVVRRISFR